MTTELGMYSDSTFRGYNISQAEEYAKRRGGYPGRLIDEIIHQHVSNSGRLGTLLDLGCGPGSATRDLAAHFDHAFGLDPGAEMIRTATKLGGGARKGPIQFFVGGAEDCPGIADDSIDLITAATSAHWFDMEKFWPTAARVLKPGGTVAFFTIWRVYFHSESTARAEEADSVLKELEQSTLGPYQMPGNWSLMHLYDDLKMPWSTESPCPAFSQDSYNRQVWNLHGRPEKDGSYMCRERVTTLDEAEKSVGTISAVTRWRNDHPLLADTDDDCVRVAFGEIGKILAARPEDSITMVGPTVLITLKKAA